MRQCSPIRFPQKFATVRTLIPTLAGPRREELAPVRPFRCESQLAPRAGLEPVVSRPRLHGTRGPLARPHLAPNHAIFQGPFPRAESSTQTVLAILLNWRSVPPARQLSKSAGYTGSANTAYRLSRGQSSSATFPGVPHITPLVLPKRGRFRLTPCKPFVTLPPSIVSPLLLRFWGCYAETV